MKFILYLSKRILLLFIVLIIPTAIALVSYSIIRLGIQPYNVGFRSIFNLAINQLPIIIFISYILAIIFSIVLIDKTKIENLFLLHIPPIIITMVILSIFTAFNLKSRTEKFFITSNSKILVGIDTFFKRGVLNDFGNKIIYVNFHNGKLISFLYDRKTDYLTYIKKIKHASNGLLLYPGNKTSKAGPIKISYGDLHQNSYFFKGKLIRNYSLRLEKLAKNIKGLYYRLGRYDKLIFLSSFILSFIIFIVPFSFLINDGAWGTTGLIGVALILAILPFFYNFIFTMELKYSGLFSFFGKYSYLVCPACFFVIGFLMDVFIKLFHKAEV
ncbi:MAG: hypothetical protein DRP84_07540 [Spirochaetes bacterium]|nr:MAG: hypothetical protein DRP84_07540 [Spirochaetota bacterium]